MNSFLAWSLEYTVFIYIFCTIFCFGGLNIMVAIIPQTRRPACRPAVIVGLQSQRDQEWPGNCSPAQSQSSKDPGLPQTWPGTISHSSLCCGEKEEDDREREGKVIYPTWSQGSSVTYKHSDSTTTICHTLKFVHKLAKMWLNLHSFCLSLLHWKSIKSTFSSTRRTFKKVIYANHIFESNSTFTIVENGFSQGVMSPKDAGFLTQLYQTGHTRFLSVYRRRCEDLQCPHIWQKTT